jgi:phosphoribosylamine---glycine ligase
MLGLYGHASAREHICFLRLAEECQDGFRFYQVGDNPILSKDPCSVPVSGRDFRQDAQKIKDDGIEVLLVTDAFYLQTDIVDACAAEGIRVLAPSRHSAEVEDHKSLMKHLVTEGHVPAPESWLVHSAEDARKILRQHWSATENFVVKADALIADAIHRVMVPESLEEAERDVEEEFAALALAGRREGLLIERRLIGFETSVHVLWDGSSYVLFPPVRDYKQVGNGDTGPNTYGAASIACGRGFSPDLERQLREKIIEPSLEALSRTGYGYRGFVYFGVMLEDTGPTLLEINVRPGNPEFVALLGLLRSGFRDLIVHAASGTLHQTQVEWHQNLYSGAVFAMGKGYPDTMTPAPVPIEGAMEAVNAGDAVVEDIGLDENGALVVTGGRVIAPIALGSSIDAVRSNIHQILDGIHFDGMHFRSDLGFGLDARLFAEV